MPTKVFLKGGGNIVVKGDTMETSVLTKWFKKMGHAIALNGHEVAFFKRDIICYEFQPEAEFKAEVEAQKKKAEEAANASHCRRCGTDSPQDFSYCPKCSAPLTKREEPTRIIPSGGKH